MKYRKNPVVIEAFRWDGTFDDAPLWLCDLRNCNTTIQDDCSIVIHTLEGDMKALIGDWIIRGIKGEVYPCKPDIFEATYEKVEELEKE